MKSQNDASFQLSFSIDYNYDSRKVITDYNKIMTNQFVK